MKKYPIFILMFCFFASILSAQVIKLKVFPEQKIWQKYYADALSHQFSLSKHLESSEWFGNIGAELSLLNIDVDSTIVQISAGATVFNTLIKTPGHVQVYTVDYLVDFYADMKLYKKLNMRFTWGHLSAHFSDDGITQLNNFPVSYVRDYAGLHYEYLLTSLNGKVYLGGFYNFHNEPVINKHTTFQFGGDAAYSLLNKLFIYCAFDIKIKSEVNNGTTRSFQIGVKYASDGNKMFRLAFTHREGFEERGQLFLMNESKNTLGFYFDF